MAATPPPATEQQVAHSTGRFDYALPAPMRSTGSTSSIYLIDVSQSALPAGVLPARSGKRGSPRHWHPSPSRDRRACSRASSNCPAPAPRPG